jgi:hypothetical protein
MAREGAYFRLYQAQARNVDAAARVHARDPAHRKASPASPPPAPGAWITDRGETEFVLRGEEFIRRLARIHLLIADSHGIHFLVRDLNALDKPSRKLLDRFL